MIQMPLYCDICQTTKGDSLDFVRDQSSAEKGSVEEPPEISLKVMKMVFYAFGIY